MVPVVKIRAVRRAGARGTDEAMSLYYFDLHVVVCYAAVYAETPLLLVNIFIVVIATAAAADNDNDDDVDDCGHHGNASRLRVQL